MPDRDSAVETRVRYPLKAILAVGGAWLLVLFQIFFGLMGIMLAVPLVPAFVGMLICGASLASAAHQYALSVAREEPRASKLRAFEHGQARKETLAARPA